MQHKKDIESIEFKSAMPNGIYGSLVQKGRREHFSLSYTQHLYCTVKICANSYFFRKTTNVFFCQRNFFFLGGGYKSANGTALQTEKGELCSLSNNV